MVDEQLREEMEVRIPGPEAEEIARLLETLAEASDDGTLEADRLEAEHYARLLRGAVK